MRDQTQQASGPKPIETLRGRIENVCLGPEWLDTRIAVAFGAALSVLYGFFAWRLARGHYFDYYNLLFDLDPPSYVNVFAPAGADPTHTGGVALAIKHPLASWLSLFSLPFRLFGLDRLHSVLAANVCVGGATVGIFFAFCRAVGTLRLDAGLITLIFGLGAAQLFSSMIVESYAYAALSLAIVWYIAWKRMTGEQRLGTLAIATDVLVFGITITNIAQAAIAELFAQWSQWSFGRAVRSTVLAGAAVAALSAVAIALTWPQAVACVMAHPLQALKEIYWQQTYGPRTGLDQVLLTFFGFSVAAPHFDKTLLPEGIWMRDFRSFDSSPASIAAILAWNGAFLVATIAALRSPRTRLMAGALVLAVFFNVVFHTRVQFRGSLFLYTPHLWFALVAVTALGIATFHDENRRLRWYLRSALLVVIIAIAPINLTRAVEASRLFDRQSDFLLEKPATTAPEHK